MSRVTSLCHATFYLHGVALRDRIILNFNRLTLLRFYFSWQVSDVKLLESSPEDEKKFKPSPNEESFKSALEENILFFTENNGRFEVVSPHKSEPVYVTNIKRGMLSALQLQFTEEKRTLIPEVRNFTSSCLNI